MNNKVRDTIPRNKEVPATPEEGGWVEQWQVRRVRRRKLRSQEMTLEELRFHRRRRPDVVISDDEFLEAWRRQYGGK